MENGVHALQTLQADHFLTQATPLTQAIFQDQYGRPLTTDSLANTYCISRLELVEALQAELPPTMIRFNEPCISLDVNQRKTVRFVQFGSGYMLRNHEFDLLIDASGGRSPLCHALNPGLHRPLSRVKEIVTSTRWPGLAAELGSRFIKTVLPERGLAFGLLAPNKERVIGFLQLDSQRYNPPSRSASENELRHFLQTVLHPAPEIVTRYLEQADLSTAHLWHPVNANIPAALSPNISRRTFSIFGFSKGYGLAGLRLGILTCPTAEIQQEIMQLSHADETAYGVSTPSQIAGIAAYQEAAAWLNEFVIHLQAQRDYAVSRLNNMEGIHCHVPEGTFVLFPNISAFGLPASALVNYLQQKCGVALVPGSPQFFGPGAAGHLRLSFATSREILTTALDRLEAGLRWL